MMATYQEIGDQMNNSLPTFAEMMFQDLPFEIRIKIYHYVIPRGNFVCSMTPTFVEDGLARKLALLALEVKYTGSKEEIDSIEKMHSIDRDSSKPGSDIVRVQSGPRSCQRYNNTIFLLSKQISDEALNVLYGENIFRLHLHEEGQEVLKENFTQRNQARMRYMLVVAAPWMARSVPDETLFASVVPYLKVLRIVARQPVRTIPHGKPPGYTFEGELARWERWLRSVMENFGRCLKDGTVVEVDVDGKEGTGEIIRQCLPGKCREVKCRLEGDRVHRRREKISDDLRHGEVRLLMKQPSL